MKISSHLLVAGVLLLMFSCSENRDNTKEGNEIENTELSDLDAIDDTEMLDPNDPANEFGQTQTMDTSAKSQTAGNLNPAHGEPGHRCDIQVGAPLDSPPGQTAQPDGSQPQMEIQQGQQQPQQGQQTKKSTNSSTKINPAHGEPGHDCSVAVGAPLN